MRNCSSASSPEWTEAGLEKEPGRRRTTIRLFADADPIDKIREARRLFSGQRASSGHDDDRGDRVSADELAQSLGDLAKKEKERREKLNSETKVITSLDADKYKSGAVTTGTPAPSPAGEKPAAEKTGAAKAPAEGAKPNPDEPTDFQGRPESFWRQALGDTRARVKELENEANVLVLRLNDLQNQFYRESDGYKQQSIADELLQHHRRHSPGIRLADAGRSHASLRRDRNRIAADHVQRDEPVHGRDDRPVHCRPRRSDP